MRRSKHGTGFKLKPYNQTFQYEGSTWSVLHKTIDTLWAVELDRNGKAGGPILKFPV